jgi:uncharacterized protein (AIM24 family)
MKLLFDVVRLVLGKVLVFVVLLALVFGAVLAARYVVSKGPEIARRVAQAQAVMERKAELTRQQERAAAELQLAEAARDATAKSLAAQGDEVLGQERARLAAQVQRAQAPAEAASRAWYAALDEVERRVDAELAQAKRTALASCEEGMLKAIACWAARREWSQAEERLREEARREVARSTEAVKLAAERQQAAYEASKVRMNEALSRLRGELDSESSKAMAPKLAAVRDAQERRAATESELAAIEAELAELSAEEEALLSLKEEWDRVGGRVLLIVLAVLLMPYAQRTVWYWLVLPFAESREPLVLTEVVGGTATVAGTGPTLHVDVSETGPLQVRPDFVTSHEGSERFVWLYDWRFPAVSYAAGLALLNEYRGSGEGPAIVTVSDPVDRHPELLSVMLDEHPGLVLHPRHLVGVAGDLSLRSVWRFFSWHAWATLQFRFILLSGTGLVLLSGGGSRDGRQLDRADVRTRQSRVVGFDARLRYATRRTGSFMQYLLGRSELIEDRHLGTGLLLTQSAMPEEPARSPVERSLDAIFAAFGKVLGF